MDNLDATFLWFTKFYPGLKKEFPTTDSQPVQPQSLGSNKIPHVSKRTATYVSRCKDLANCHVQRPEAVDFFVHDWTTGSIQARWRGEDADSYLPGQVDVED